MEPTGKFYKEDEDQYTAVGVRRTNEAKDAADTVVEGQILHLLHVAEKGLPDHYKTFGEFLFDFWMDFVWDSIESCQQAKKVAFDPRIVAIVPEIQKIWGLNLIAVLTNMGMPEEVVLLNTVPEPEPHYSRICCGPFKNIVIRGELIGEHKDTIKEKIDE